MILTIGGFFGSGAKEVAKLLAERSGYTLCSDDIVTEAIKDYGIDIESMGFKFYDESIGDGSVYELTMKSRLNNSAPSVLVHDLSTDVLPLDERIKNSQKEVINKLADQGNCIFLGRCADYYLADRENVLHVFAYNKEENCADLIAEAHDLPHKKALKLVRKCNKRRAEYYEYFTGRKWNAPYNYDMTINMDTLGIEGATDLLAKICVKD